MPHPVHKKDDNTINHRTS